MKNSILPKFLAVLLCASSLLGIAGGAAGALVLAEANLYNKTVEEILDEQFQSDATAFAEHTALNYASKTLGDCPDDMLRHGVTPSCEYGYTILDAEGNVLTSVNPELKDSSDVYNVPVRGQYMHLVSTESASQKLANETAARLDSISRGIADSDGETIPNGGIPVHQVIFTDKDGAPLYEAYTDTHSCHSTFYYSDEGNVRSSSSYDHSRQNQIGFLYYGTEGQLMYHSFLEENESVFTATEVYGVLFSSHTPAFLLQTDDPEGIGTLLFENGCLYFSGYPVQEEIPEETLPEETVPETSAETIPEVTEAETQPTEAPQPVTETYPEEYTEDNSEDWEEGTETWYEEDQEDASYASALPEEDTEEYNETYEEETVAPETLPPETLPPETLPPETIPPETVPEETSPAVTEPILINGKPLDSYQINRTEFYDSTLQEHSTAKYVYLPMPEMTVEVYLNRASMTNAEIYDVLRLVRQYRDYLLPVIGICLLIFAITAVYLCTAAGRKPKTDEVRAGGLNRIPLDLYLGLSVFAGAGIIALAALGVPQLLNRDFQLGCSAALGAAFACCLLLTAWLFAFVAQIKTPDGFWWRNLLCIRFIFLCMRLLKWLERWLRETSLPYFGRLIVKIWNLILKFMILLYKATETVMLWTGGKVGRIFRWIGRKLNRWLSLMPVTWQWTVTGALLFCLILIACNSTIGLLTLICLLASLALILYGSHCFGVLLDSTRKMARGNLDSKVEDKLMMGCFREFADDLSDLADVAMVTAQKQLKSERMKTELITNVSHDIKTPLTSIINYVDLLQKPHTEEEGQQYMEVLNRQSQRLKKLVEDLMEMSKASTGNMTVEITRVDAVESVNQALGEFADKLERSKLYPVFRHSEDSVPIMADGKLVWRVLSNLLGNAVKYAMPGTRLYLDLTTLEGKAILSLKNISRDELNVDAEELMERFVRGDVSRNTEGSGLGLNIAKSLMELQKGQLQILVDGDLFKVTLIFPIAE